MESESAAIDLLEARVSNLEKLLYGSGGISNLESTPVIDTLLSTNTLLNAAANGNPNISAVFKRLNELNRDLSDSAFEPGAEMDRKVNKILSMEQEYLNNVAMLEKLQTVDAALDSGHLKAIIELKPQLAALVDAYTGLSSNLEDGRVGDVLLTWHTLVNEVNKAFLSANNAIGEVEIKKLQLSKKKAVE